MNEMENNDTVKTEVTESIQNLGFSQLKIEENQ